MSQIKQTYQRPTKIGGFTGILGVRDPRSLSALDSAMLDLMLNRPFYASLLIEANVVRINPGTAGVDGKNLFICDQWFEGLTKPWRLGVLAHEALHIGMAHHARMGNRRHDLCNIAMDCAINQLLADDGLQLPPDACWIAEIGPKFGLDAQTCKDLKHASWEEIYFYLAQSQAQQPQPPQPPQPPQGGEEGEGQPGQGQPVKGNPVPSDEDGEASEGDTDGDQPEGEGDKPSGKPGQPGNSPHQQSWGNVTPMDDDASETEIEAEIMEASRKMETALAEAIIRDKAGDALKSAVKSNNAPRKDWKALLRAWFIKGHTIRGYTFSKLPRRPNTYRLPVALTEGAPKIIVLLDKSGSIGEAATMAYIEEMNGIMNEACPSEVILVPFDHDTYEVETFACGEEIEYVYQSGGGTNFAGAFERVEELWNPGDKVVMFTDMECSIPPPPSFENDLLWVAVAPHYIGPKPTYGEIIEIARHEV